MAKKLFVGVLGLGIVVAGIAAFAAFTAQVINLEAHVEKEIEIAPCIDTSEDPDGSLTTVIPLLSGDEVDLNNDGDFDDAGEDPDGSLTTLIPLLTNDEVDYNLDGDFLDVVCIEDQNGGNFGVVLPQETYDKRIEVTLSASFNDQTKFDDVVFAVMWECKQERNGFGPSNVWDNRVKDANGKYTTLVADGVDPKDTFPDCLDNLPHTDSSHPNGELDANLRLYTTIVPDINRCLSEDPPSPDGSKKPLEKEVELVGYGTIQKGIVELSKKCFYTVKLLAPPCEGEFNPFTDPFFDPAKPTKTIKCHFDKPTLDPQTWEHFADIGDDFKIQVIEHSLAAGP